MNQIISDRPPVQTQDSPSPMLAAALSYAARGWHVFPVAQGKKAPPTTEHGCYDGTTDPTTILRWWGDHPYANIGIATGDKSGLLVVDLDIYKEPEALPSFQAQHGTHKTYTVKTPRGGLHLYFSLRPRQKARCTNEEKGMCIKGTGGYVVAPPSNTNDGRYAVSDARSPAKTPASLCGPAPARQTRNSSSRPSAPPRVALNNDRDTKSGVSGVSVLFRLVVASLNLRPIPKPQQALVGRKFMAQPGEQPPLQFLEMLRVGFADLPQQQTFQPRCPLAIIRTHLGQQPMRFPAPPRSAISNRCRPARPVTEPRRG